MVGNYPGGGFDIYARAVARHLGRNIPGNPTIVVKNMPGAGSAKAGIHISQVAPKDGTVDRRGDARRDRRSAARRQAASMFDPTKVTYLGTANAARASAPPIEKSKMRTVRAGDGRRPSWAAWRPATRCTTSPTWCKRTTGAQIDVVAGYKGTLDVTLAMERGEIDGACGWDWSSAKAQKPDWIRDGKLNFLLQIGPTAERRTDQDGRAADLGLMKDDDSRKVRS